jgi:putative addiction module component (TIGR02574 family)
MQRRREFQLFQPREHGLAARNGWCILFNMPITLDQIVEETREMPGEVVAELIDRIIVARHGGIEPSIAESWKTETDRRIAEIESGKAKGVTPEENAARIQKILRR